MITNNISTNLIEKDVLIDHFTINDDDRNVISKIKNEKNKLGFAVFLKTFQYIGYPPRTSREVSDKIINHIAQQLKLEASAFYQYKWKGRTWIEHHSRIREYTGYRLFTKDDYILLSTWLSKQEDINPVRSVISEKLRARCKELLIELPKEKEFERLITTARKSFYTRFYTTLSMSLNIGIYLKMNNLLSIDTREYSFNWLKSPPGPLGMDTILDEIKKLKYIRSFQIDEKLFENTDATLLGLLYNRCLSYDSINLVDHKEFKRYSLLSIFLYIHEMKVIDTIIQIFIDLVRRLENSTEKKIEAGLGVKPRYAHF